MSHRFSAAFQPAGPHVIEMQIPSALGRRGRGESSRVRAAMSRAYQKALLYSHTARGAERQRVVRTDTQHARNSPRFL